MEILGSLFNCANQEEIEILHNHKLYRVTSYGPLGDCKFPMVEIKVHQFCRTYWRSLPSNSRIKVSLIELARGSK